MEATEEIDCLALSDDAKARVEQIALAVFHDLLIGITDVYLKQLKEATRIVGGMQIDAAVAVHKRLDEELTLSNIHDAS